MTMSLQTFHYPTRAEIRRRRDAAVVRLSAAACAVALAVAGWMGLSATL
jgi:hypothetical protein